MRILFMGTPDFSVPTLETLIDSKHEIVAVVTQPDKPKGRGKQRQYTPVKEAALKHDIKVFQPAKVREEDFIHEMRNLNIDLAIVIAFGQILPKGFLELPRYGCMNIHASLLPKYRGAGPIQWAIINGDAKTGVTTMYMDVGLDTGDMLLKEEIILDKNETGGTLHDKMSVIGGPLILKTIDRLMEHILIREKQVNEDSTYAPMLNKQLGNIDWGKPAIEIERLIRGLNPWPSAFTYLNGRLLKLWESDVVEIEDNEHMSGSIYDIRPDGFVVKCQKNGLLIKTLQLQGKKRMKTSDFLRGYAVEIGQMLSQIQHIN